MGTSSISLAQSGTYSPYSRYGLGEITSYAYGQNLAMGGIGIGMRDHNKINFLNPASFSSQDTMSFLLDIGMSARIAELKTSSATDNLSNTGFDHLAISIPITKFWKSSLGVVPFSSVGYKIEQIEEDDVLGNLIQAYQGNGGINTVIFGNAFHLYKGLHFGFNLKYYFGPLEYEKSFRLEENNTYTTYTNDNLYVKGFNYNLGLQYHMDFAGDKFLNLGVVLEPESNLSRKNKHELLTVIGSSVIDTIEYNSSNDEFRLPQTIGAGFTAGIKNKLLAGFDFQMEDWSKTDGNIDFQDQTNLRFGIEYIPDYMSITSYLDKISYRAGGFYRNTYLNINNEDIKNYGITFGVGLPVTNMHTRFNIGVELGRRGTTASGLLEENYANFNFSLTLYDIWFYKRKFQ